MAGLGCSCVTAGLGLRRGLGGCPGLGCVTAGVGLWGRVSAEGAETCGRVRTGCCWGGQEGVWGNAGGMGCGGREGSEGWGRMGGTALGLRYCEWV